MKRLALLAIVFLALPLLGAEVKVDNTIIPVGSAPELVIPAAGSIAGANGTYFKSDITILNYSNHAQTVRLRWLPQGQTGSGLTATDVTLAALSGITSEDFVATVLRQTGLGAVLVTSLTNTGALDTTGRLYATARIWTPEPGTGGTTSQSFFVLPTSTFTTAQRSIIGQRRDDRYRLNVGVVNLDPLNPQLYQIVVAGTSPGVPTENTTVTVRPLSMEQVPLSGPPQQGLQIVVANITSINRSSAWTAYGSSVDNVTGDAWSTSAFTPNVENPTP
ncbi:MAG: hypothetical protein JWN02_832 [Acidobacteria bacterium]|nr:hypothetical protein [Acidobacteriota bacterium]